jgi:GNAT superfamily N-acetyltransferase
MPEQGQKTLEELGLAAENTIYDYSWEYEGERERRLGGSHALVHALDVPWYGSDGFAGKLRFDEDRVDEQLDEVLAEAGDAEGHFVWITGPSTQPANVSDLLARRGLLPAIFWEGLALQDISWPYADPPEVRVEQLSAENIDDYIAVSMRDYMSDDVRIERLAAARRLIAAGQREAAVFICYFDGEPAGCSVMRVEANGIVYLRNAFVLDAFQGRGLYIAMVGARLALARAAGCVAAVVQAQRQSSAPILKKRGFVKVCELVGHSRGETKV